MTSEAITAILADVRAKRWNNEPFSRFAALRRADPTLSATLVRLALDELHDHSSIVATALSHVSPEEFRDLVSLAMTHLRSGSNLETAETVIEYASLQLPQLLHPHLPELFELRPNRRAYYENYAWREAPDTAIDHLVSVVDSDKAKAFKAWLCLLEIRSPKALATALSLASRVALRHPIEAYFHEVGYQPPDIPLFQSRVAHLVFPPDYFEAERPVWLEREHPSWLVQTELATARFGGSATAKCGLCRGLLHHLINLPPQLSPLAHSLPIVTCLSCLGWEQQPLYYDHSGEEVVPLDVTPQPVTPEFPAVALKETEVMISETPSRWRWQEWGTSNSRENLNRIGGHPSWVQSADYPECIRCTNRMSFILQLDSDLPSVEGEEWLWGSGGVCYAFWCTSCRVSALHWQCT